MKRIYILFYLFSLLVLGSCEANYSPLSENIYIADAQDVNFKRLTVDDKGGETSIVVRMASPATTEVHASLASDVNVLNEYNRLNGTNFLPLPEHLYSFEQSDITLHPGELSSSPIRVTIHPYDESVDASHKYAIPVKLSNVEGTSLLEGSSHLMLLLDQVIVTNIFEYNGRTIMRYNVEEGDLRTDNLSEWSLEFLIRCKSFSTNKHVLSISEKESKPIQQIFCRFGNVDRPTNEIQFKVSDGIPIYGNTKFTPNRWYHVALTYDGSNLDLYIDGKLDLTVAHGMPGQIFSWRIFELRPQNPGSMSEVRIWNRELTPGEIANNMYVVNPRSEGLIAYWKFNEGEGTTIHDYSVNERHFTNIIGTWVSGQRFPENME